MVVADGCGVGAVAGKDLMHDGLSGRAISNGKVAGDTGFLSDLTDFDYGLTNREE
jgi:hypothetical protein